MLIVRQDTHPHVYDAVEQRNDELRTRFLDSNIKLACSYNPVPCFVTGKFIETLNHLTMLNLTDKPGEIRDFDVQISGSPHTPPLFWQVKDPYYFQMIRACHENWNIWEPDEMAAYLMWRLTWIHPFEDGNGRTSRALGYFTLACKYGNRLPGNFIVTRYLEENRRAYFEALRYADITLGQERTDLMPLRRMIQEGVRRQLDMTLER